MYEIMHNEYVRIHTDAAKNPFYYALLTDETPSKIVAFGVNESDITLKTGNALEECRTNPLSFSRDIDKGAEIMIPLEQIVGLTKLALK